ncbi:MAG: hypothetical protein WB681_05715 [Candidatus Cybelea sp.]
MKHRGLIHDYLIKYPLRYCIPVFIGVLTAEDQTMRASATATMLDLYGRKLLITDDHVIASFEKFLSEDSRVKFQTGAEIFDPRNRCIDRHATKDLFVIDATGLTLDDRSSDEELPKLEFYVVPNNTSWPPPLVKVSDTIILGGFPGAMRREEGFNVVCGSYSIASIPVTGVFADHFSCNIDRTTWQSTRADDQWVREFTRWGGLSGGPVFQDGPGLLRPRLTGFIQQYHAEYDQLQIAHAASINVDGTIAPGRLF